MIILFKPLNINIFRYEMHVKNTINYNSFLINLQQNIYPKNLLNK